MTMPAYTCPYCRLPGTGQDGACPNCGAPVDVRLRMSESGWIEQPPIRDMARIRFGGSICQISGSYVPVAEMSLAREDWVYFCHDALLHAGTGVQLGSMALRGAWKRMRAGMPLIMMRAQGPGTIAFSASHPGETLAVPLTPGRSVEVVEHRFLVATGNVEYQWENSNVWFTTQDGDDTEWHYPLGRTLDVFSATGSPGLLLLHGPGNTFLRDLQPGERILVQPGGLIWKDRGVRMFLHFEYPHGQYWFSSARWQAKTIWLTLEGPGRVAVQSVFERPEVVGAVRTSSGATTQFW
jgi:uncharacterized protein (AIM24 family)